MMQIEPKVMNALPRNWFLVPIIDFVAIMKDLVPSNCVTG